MAEAEGASPIGALREYAGRADPGNGWFLCDGRAVSRSTYATLFAAIVPAVGTFTVTVATPGVFTLAGHGLLTGDSVYLTTTGALPTGLTANTAYYVNRIDASTFNLSASISSSGVGAPVATSGTQSGTHTLSFCPYGLGDGSTTFNLPDARGRSILAPDNMGTAQGAAGRLTTSIAALGRTQSGEELHTLTSAESGLASHSHGGNTTAGNTNTTSSSTTGTGGPYGGAANVNADHSHGVSGASQGDNSPHAHQLGVRTQNMSPGNTQNFNQPNSSNPSNYATAGISANHTHTASSNVGAVTDTHSHNATMPSLSVATSFSGLSISSEAAASAASGHNNMPLYAIANQIIRAL